MNRTLLGLCVSLCLCPLPLWAATGADVLQTTQLPRAIALGGAYVGLADDVNAPLYNPAGLARSLGPGLSFIHTVGLVDSTEYLAFAHPVRAGGILGGGVVYRYLPTIQNEGATDPAVEANDILATLTYATRFETDRQTFGDLTAGLTGKYLRSRLGGLSATALAVDLGGWWRPAALPTLQVGLALQHLGAGLKFDAVEDPLPLTARLGLGWMALAVSPHTVNLAVDASLSLAGDDPYGSLGAEYVFSDLVAVRAGYRLQADSLAGGICGGVGFKYAAKTFRLQFDYAFQPVVLSESTLEAQHYISLTLGL